MDPITPPVIPEKYLSFAKAIGALADSHGISECQIKITPDWRDQVPPGQRVNGDVQINYASKDGRGRPCVNLDVYVNTHTIIRVVSNPESSN